MVTIHCTIVTFLNKDVHFAVKQEIKGIIILGLGRWFAINVFSIAPGFNPGIG